MGGKGTRDSHKEETEGWSGTVEEVQRPLAEEGKLYLDVCRGTRVPSYAIADGARLSTQPWPV